MYMKTNYRFMCSILEASDVKVGDTVLVGKWKNRTAIIKSFATDKNNQPTMVTDKGTYSLYKFRIKKLMPKKKEKKS